MVFLRVRIITRGGWATSLLMIPSRGCAAHADDRLDRGRIDIMALVERCEANEHVLGAGGGIRPPSIIHELPRAAMFTPRRVLDHHQMTVVIAETMARAKYGCSNSSSRRARSGMAAMSRLAIRRAAFCSGSRPRGCSARRWSSDARHGPDRASLSTCTDCSQGDLQSFSAGRAALRSIRI